MWDLSPDDTDAALLQQARNPLPPKPPKASTWAQAGELLAAPFKGVGQAGQQTLRLGNRAMGPAAGDPFAVSPAEQQSLLDEAGITPERVDQDLRRGIEALKPDPVASTTASLILQDGARLLSKVGAYSLAGPVGMVGGAALDEAATGYLELRDKGVDPATAAKAGAVRGVGTGLGVALPVAGRTVGQTLGLVVAGGPGAFMAEQALTREILESANYPELAAEHDPFDPVGLGVSALLTGTVGAVAHRARMKGATAPAAQAEPAPNPVVALADVPEVRDAAHLVYRERVTEAHMLGDKGDPAARASHAQALETAARAMEDGEPVRIASLEVDPARAARIVEELGQRLRVADEQMAAVRAAEPVFPEPALPPASEPGVPQTPPPPVGLQQVADTLSQQLGLPARVEPVGDAQPQGLRSPLERAEEAVQGRPDVPVRLDEADAPMAARELLEDVRQRVRLDRDEARAFDAAIECFLRTGT